MHLHDGDAEVLEIGRKVDAFDKFLLLEVDDLQEALAVDHDQVVGLQLYVVGHWHEQRQHELVAVVAVHSVDEVASVHD